MKVEKQLERRPVCMLCLRQVIWRAARGAGWRARRPAARCMPWPAAAPWARAAGRARPLRRVAANRPCIDSDPVAPLVALPACSPPLVPAMRRMCAEQAAAAAELERRRAELHQLLHKPETVPAEALPAAASPWALTRAMRHEMRVVKALLAALAVLQLRATDSPCPPGFPRQI